MDQNNEDKGKVILKYYRKRFRKNNNNDDDIFLKEDTALHSSLAKQQPQPPRVAEPPLKTTTDWADPNSGHLLTCACRFCTGTLPTTLFRSNIIPCPPRRVDTTTQTAKDASFGTKVSQAKVFPSIVIPPSSSSPSSSSQKIHRKISQLPPLEDISFIESLACGTDDSGQKKAPPSQPSISFMDILQNDNNKLKKMKRDHAGLSSLGQNDAVKVADYRTYLPQRFFDDKSSGGGRQDLQQKALFAGGSCTRESELKSKSSNGFVKMMMEEDGVDDEQLLMEVKQELMIREVDAYASLLRKPDLDLGKLIIKPPRK